MPVNMPEIVFIIGLKKSEIESNKLRTVSSPNKPNVRKSNIPPRPAVIASEKLPVS